MKKTERRQWGCVAKDANDQVRVSPVERCLGVNRSRGDVLSCAFVVLTLTAAETQLTKGFSLSPAATPRHSAVASGKANGFSECPNDVRRGVAGIYTTDYHRDYPQRHY